MSQSIKQEAGSQLPLLGEVTDQAKAEIIALAPWLESASEFMVQDDGLKVHSNRKVIDEKLCKLLKELGHKDITAKHILRGIKRQTRIFGQRPDRVSILYPLQIPSGSSPRAYPEKNPDSINLKLDIGKFVIFKDPLFVSGVLDFLLIRVKEVDVVDSKGDQKVLKKEEPEL